MTTTSTAPVTNCVAAEMPVIAPLAAAPLVRNSPACWRAWSMAPVSTGSGPEVMKRCSSSQPSAAWVVSVSHSLRTEKTIPVRTPPTSTRMPTKAASVASRLDQPRRSSHLTAGDTAAARISATSSAITTTCTRMSSQIAPPTTAAISRVCAARDPARPRPSAHGPTAGATDVAASRRSSAASAAGWEGEPGVPIRVLLEGRTAVAGLGRGRRADDRGRRALRDREAPRAWSHQEAPRAQSLPEAPRAQSLPEAPRVQFLTVSGGQELYSRREGGRCGPELRSRREIGGGSGLAAGGAEHPRLLLQARGDADEHVVGQRVGLLDMRQPLLDAVGGSLEALLELADHLVVGQAATGQRVHPRGGGHGGGPPVGLTADGDQPLGDVVGGEADLVGHLVELQVHRPEVRPVDVPVGLLGLQGQVDEVHEGLLQAREDLLGGLGSHLHLSFCGTRTAAATVDGTLRAYDRPRRRASACGRRTWSRRPCFRPWQGLR